MDDKEQQKITNKDLLEQQKEMLKTFLACGAISQELYDYEIDVLEKKIIAK